VVRYRGDRKELYSRLKLEGLLEAPLHLCVLCDHESERGHYLGRNSMAETSIYSVVCAIQNLWLAARTEGIGVGWVSILSRNYAAGASMIWNPRLAALRLR
jgi:5,6-dimethylbenzimidazole synthase